MAHEKTTAYLDALPSIVESYNSRRHSSIGVSPNLAEKRENWPVVSYHLEKNFYMRNVKRKTPKFKRGDRVRIAENRSQWSRAYDPYFRLEIFEIDKISRKFAQPLYYVKDPVDNEPLIGAFYQNELIAAREDEEF